MTGSVREMLAWLAANEPGRLDELAAMAALTPDDPALDDVHVEARRRLVERINAAKAGV